MGFVIFGETPGADVLTGGALIILGGVVLSSIRLLNGLTSLFYLRLIAQVSLLENLPSQRLSASLVSVSWTLSCCFCLWPSSALSICSDPVPEWHGFGCGRSPIACSRRRVVSDLIGLRWVAAFSAASFTLCRMLPCSARQAYQPDFQDGHCEGELS